MIFGLGSDIIAVARLEKAIKRNGDRFLTTVFTSKEISYCQGYQQSTPHFAARFAAKEAVVKALGTGFRHGITWQDIEILNETDGKPEVHISDKVVALMGKGRFLVTLSHCQEYATATAIWIA